MARGLLMLSLDMEVMAMEDMDMEGMATEDMDMVDMVITMARDLLMPSLDMEVMEDMAMEGMDIEVMDMVVMDTIMARDLLMLSPDTEDMAMEVMVMVGMAIEALAMEVMVMVDMEDTDIMAMEDMGMDGGKNKCSYLAPNIYMKTTMLPLKSKVQELSNLKWIIYYLVNNTFFILNKCYLFNEK